MAEPAVEIATNIGMIGGCIGFLISVVRGSYRKRVETVSTEVKVLKERVGAAERDIVTVRSDVDVLQCDTGELKVKAATVAGRLEATTEKLSEISETLTKLVDRLIDKSN